jgi:hypothetical protein
MADSRAYTYTINPFGAGQDENNAINQSSPAWVLTFVGWANRDPIRTPGTLSTKVSNPIVVENDCVSISVTTKKGVLTPSMSAILVVTDVNYETQVAPGDFVLVNMLNWDVDARRVADAARAQQPINGVHDGFKGIFKVQGVRRSIVSDPETGVRTLRIRIDGFAFTEFNNTIYFNPYILDPTQDPNNQLLFASYVGTDWKLLINRKGLTDVQNIIAVLTQSFIGNGISDNGQYVQGNLRSPNIHFYMPTLVGKLLGVPNVTAAKDIYNYIFGIQQYAGGSVNAALSTGMNPIGLSSPFGRFYYTPTPCEGNSLLKPEYWNQVKTWSILNQYTNSPLNELYTCFRVSPNNRVMPTVVFRQIPFTNEDYASTILTNASPDVKNLFATITVTRFLTLPRWKIDTSLILEADIGRDESARINFVQYYGRSTLGAEGADISFETAAGNYLFDIDDVQRSGLRPYVITTQFDDPTDVKPTFRSPIWAKILGDCLIGGHLKTNGTVVTAGIVPPIAIGDNLQIGGTVYHIEQVMHSCNYNGITGERTFRTTLSLSNGISTSSTANGTRYPEMTDTNAYLQRTVDYQYSQIMPGISESQDLVPSKYRNDVDANQSEIKGANNAPFPQPATQNGSGSGTQNNGQT